MRRWSAILAILAAAALYGCSGSGPRWPWEQPDVPVTAPKEQVKLAAPSPTPKPPPKGTADTGAATNNTSGADTSAGATSQPSLTAGQLPGPIRLVDLPEARVPFSPPPATPSPSAPPFPAASASPKPTPIASVAPSPSPSPTAEPVRPEVVATLGIQVNKKYITVEDILRSAAGELAELPKNLTESAFRQRASLVISRAVRTQIENAAILPEAEGKLTEEETKRIDEEMDKTLRAMVAEVGGSHKKLEEIWVARGTTLASVLQEQRNRLLVTRYLQSKIIPDIKITRKMLLDYYAKHKADEFTRNKKVQMQILAVPLALPSFAPSDAQIAEAKAAARKKIEEAAKDVRSGGDFTKAVEAYTPEGSRGPAKGIWPLMEAGSFREKKVEEAAFALPGGAVSDIVETESGFYLVKVLRIEGGQVTSFEDAQEEIEKKLTEDQYQRLHEKYILAKSPSIASSERLQEVAMEKAFEKYWRK